MALINSLKSTRLKNLRYTGLGPAVQKDINNPPVYNSFSREKKSRLNSHTKKNFNLLFFGIIREDKGLDILINALRTNATCH